MNVSLITPDANVFEGEASSIKLPGSKGSFEVLNNHAAIVSSLDNGKISIKTNEGDKQYNITSGVVEVLNNNVIILAESLIEE